MTTWLDYRVDKLLDELEIDTYDRLAEKELRKFASEIASQIIKCDCGEAHMCGGLIAIETALKRIEKMGIELENAKQSGIELEGRK